MSTSVPAANIDTRNIGDVSKDIAANRRLALAMGYDPDTSEVLSLTQHHTRLVMMSATQDEYRYYYERIRGSGAR